MPQGSQRLGDRLLRLFGLASGIRDTLFLVSSGGAVLVAGFAFLLKSPLSFRLALFIGGALLIFGTLNHVFSLTAARRKSVASNEGVDSTEVSTTASSQHPLRPPRELSDDLASASYIKDRALYIFDLARRRTVIKGKTIEDCDIHGLAVAAVLSGTDFIDCTFAEGGDHSALIWPKDPSRSSYVGAIGLEECIFRRCNFVGVGLLTNIDYGDQQAKDTEL